MPFDDYFLADLPSFTPLAGVAPHRPLTGFEGLPLFNQPGAAGLAAQLFAGPPVLGFMQTAGLTPGGLSGMNPLRIMQSRAYTASMRAGLEEASRADRDNYMRTLGGIARLTGTPFGARQRMAAGELADVMTAATPFLAEAMPEWAEAFAGQQGSATVMSMRMASAGRMRFNPVSGRLDETGAYTQGVSRQMYQDLFAPGGPGLAATGGLSAGRYGMAFEELTRRGLVGSAGTTMSAGELDQMRSNPTLAQSDRLKSMDFAAVKKTLSGYAEALSAIRDVFGDMGMPDAPVPKLFEAMDKLTRGGLGHLSPDKLASTIRMTRELGNLSGMDMGAMTVLADHAGSRAAQLGLDPYFGVSAAQGAAAFGAAYRATGATPMWGRFNADQMTQLDANLRVQGAASRLGSRMAVAARVGEAAGGFEAGSAAANFLEAARAQRTGFVDPATGRVVEFAAMGEGEFARMLTGARGASGKAVGVTGQEVYSMLGQREANQEYIAREGFDATVRVAQGAEAMGKAREWYRTTLGAQFRSHGIDAGKAAGASDAVVAALSNMSDADRADPARRTRLIARAIEGAAGLAEGQGAQIAGAAYGEVDRALGRDQQWHSYRNQANLFTVHSEQRLADAARVKEQARDNAELSKRFAPLAQGGGVLANFVTALQKVDAHDPAALAKVIGGTLGGMPAGEQTAQLRDVIKGYGAEYQATRDLMEKARTAAPGEARERARRELADHLKNTESKIKAAQEKATAIEKGMAPDLGTKESDFKAASDSAAAAERYLGDGEVRRLRGIRDKGQRGREFAQYWQSHGGVLDELKDADEHYAGLLSDVRGLRTGMRFGAAGRGVLREAEGNEARLRELAKTYAQGDLQKLEAGDFEITGDETPEARKKVSDEVGYLLKRRSAIAGTLRGDHKQAVTRNALTMSIGGGLLGGIAQAVNAAEHVAGVPAEAAHEKTAERAGHGGQGGSMTIAGTLKLDMAAGTAQISGHSLGYKDASASRGIG